MKLDLSNLKGFAQPWNLDADVRKGFARPEEQRPKSRSEIRSCERTKTNASQSDHVERKAVTAQNTVFCPRIADFTRKC